ncbi:MAG: division/cell wall cluster transcriptional repressor MraZ [Betaproteobacteria bacterium]|nr:division/cell wall cluster transcriptional repressor MraZ [Betaproteobacteria bacterium]
MFRGVAQLSLDSKCRLAVPSRYREALLVRCAGRLVITADFDKCLLIYPQSDWEPIQQKLMGLSSLNARIRGLQRQLVGYAEDIEMDAAGRVLVSSALREFAGLGKNVVLVGQDNKFELWDKEKWEQALERGTGFGDGDLPPELEGFSL